MSAAASLLVSDAPSLVAWPGALLAIAWGLALARREARRAPFELILMPSASRGAMPVAKVDGRSLPVLRLRWRGPVAFLDLDNDGRRWRLVFGPDVLSSSARRELRLLVPRAASASTRPSMAP